MTREEDIAAALGAATHEVGVGLVKLVGLMNAQGGAMDMEPVAARVVVAFLRLRAEQLAQHPGRFWQDQAHTMRGTADAIERIVARNSGVDITATPGSTVPGHG